MFTSQSCSFNLKSNSLISQLSNAHLNKPNFHGSTNQYFGSHFLNDSIFLAHSLHPHSNDLKQEEIEFGSLSTGHYKAFPNQNECISAFTPYWTEELDKGIEGTSDNENDLEPDLVKQENDVKIEEEYANLGELPDLLDGKISSGENSEQKITKNETKNIPKNYGKAIIIFIEKNRMMLEGILKENEHDYDALLSKLRSIKKKINTISDLRNLWEEEPESKSIRIISNVFLRKYSLHYIYNSRIKTRLCHAKYKRRLQQAILNPKNFNHIKDY